MFDWLITGFNWIIDHTFGYLYQLVCYLLCLILPENFTRIIRPISETETKQSKTKMNEGSGKIFHFSKLIGEFQTILIEISFFI